MRDVLSVTWGAPVAVSPAACSSRQRRIMPTISSSRQAYLDRSGWPQHGDLPPRWRAISALGRDQANTAGGKDPGGVSLTVGCVVAFNAGLASRYIDLAICLPGRIEAPGGTDESFLAYDLTFDLIALAIVALRSIW